MTSHILAPLKALVRRIRASVNGSQIEPDPLTDFLVNRFEVPSHLVGRPFNITDTEGNIVASVNQRPVDPRIAGMLG